MGCCGLGRCIALKTNLCTDFTVNPLFYVSLGGFVAVYVIHQLKKKISFFHPAFSEKPFNHNHSTISNAVTPSLPAATHELAAVK